MRIDRQQWEEAIAEALAEQGLDFCPNKNELASAVMAVIEPILAAVEGMREALVELDRLCLVIESAVRWQEGKDSETHQQVSALLKKACAATQEKQDG